MEVEAREMVEEEEKEEAEELEEEEETYFREEEEEEGEEIVEEGLSQHSQKYFHSIHLHQEVLLVTKIELILNQKAVVAAGVAADITVLA